jgi:hypothetical protein
MKRIQWPLDHSLGLAKCRTQTFSQEAITLVKKCCHVSILKVHGLWTLTSSVKGREAETMVSCNLIGGDRRPLDLRL